MLSLPKWAIKICELKFYHYFWHFARVHGISFQNMLNENNSFYHDFGHHKSQREGVLKGSVGNFSTSSNIGFKLKSGTIRQLIYSFWLPNGVISYKEKKCHGLVSAILHAWLDQLLSPDQDWTEQLILFDFKLICPRVINSPALWGSLPPRYSFSLSSAKHMKSPTSH